MDAPLTDWVKSFLAARALEQPDGRWLYAYQTTEEEFGALGALLRSLTAAAPVSLVRGSAHFEAGFVAFAAEWWRRCFAGGPWRWTPILEALGIPQSAWAPVDRQSAVVRGLKFWGHAPGTIGLAYLGAIAAQGGLPTRVIAAARGPLAQLLARALRKAARVNLTAEDIAKVILGDSQGLPASLRQDEVVQLIAQMIESILRLRSQLRLAEVPDPVRELDQRHPGWRQEFPLQLEDSVARALLDMLVGEAARAQTAPIGRPVSVRRFLQEAPEGEWQLRSTVEVQPRIPASVVEHWVGTTRALPGILLLDALAGRRELVAVLSLRPGQESEQCYRAEVVRPVWQGSDAAGEHLLAVRSGLEEIARVAVQRGDPLDPSLPWVFAREDEVWVLVACGSTSLAAAEALMLLPPDSTLTATTSERPLRVLYVDGQRRLAACVRSQTQVIGADGRRFRIKVGEVGAEPPDFGWEGQRLWLKSRPERVFLGMPRLFRFDPEGHRERIAARELVDHTQSPISPEALGRLRVSWLRDGIIEQSWNLVVLPAGAEVDYRPTSPRGGEITLRHWGNARAAVTTPEVSAEVLTDGDELTLKLEATGTPPEAVAVEVWWEEPGKGMQVTFPFPARGVRLIDASGADLSVNRSLPRQLLAGMRLRLIESVPAAQSSYAVSLSLLDRRNGIRPARQHRPVFERGVAEYRLLDFRDDIDEMFSFTDDIDARIEILVTQHGAICARLVVSRADLATEITGAWLRVIEGARPHEGCPLGSVVAVDLSCPEKERKTLQALASPEGDTAWDLSPLREDSGLWMISSATQDGAAIRPVLLPVGPIAAAADGDGTVSALVKAVCEPNPPERERRLSTVLGQVGESLEHRDWSTLGVYATQLAHLPLGAFDLWRRLATRPLLAAEFLLRPPPGAAREGTHAILGRFDRELPFLWEGISARDWSEAVQRLKDWLATQLGELADEVLPGLIEQRFSQAPRTLADLGPVLAFSVAHPASQDLQARVVALIREGLVLARNAQQRLWRDSSSLYQSLLQRRVHQTWPEDPELLQLIRSAHSAYRRRLPALSAVLTDLREIPPHRLSVTYLPIVLAMEAVLGSAEGMTSHLAHVRSARMMRSFDVEWFESAFVFMLRICIAHRN